MFNNKRLIDIQIEAIQKIFPLYEIIVCVGFDSEKVCKYIRQKYRNINIRIVENQIFSNSNSSESTRIALNNISNDKITDDQKKELIKIKEEIKELCCDEYFYWFEQLPLSILKKITLNTTNNELVGQQKSIIPIVDRLLTTTAQQISLKISNKILINFFITHNVIIKN